MNMLLPVGTYRISIMTQLINPDKNMKVGIPVKNVPTAYIEMMAVLFLSDMLFTMKIG